MEAICVHRTDKEDVIHTLTHTHTHSHTHTLTHTDKGLSRKSEVLPFATTWMGPEDIMLSEINQKKINTV